MIGWQFDWLREPVLPTDCKPAEESITLLFGSTPNPVSPDQAF